MATKSRWAITDEIAIADALKCKTRTEFAEKYSGSWRRLSNKGFNHLDAACSHMTGYTQWNTGKCVDVARTCKTRSEFKKHTGAYCHASENNLFDLCYAHMGPPKTVGRKKGNTNAKLKQMREQSAPAPKTTKDKIFDLIKNRIFNQ